LARNHGVHMTLATKNGSLIVQDGKIAEDCGCCGGWYCDGGQCDSCVSGVAPSVINAVFTLQVRDGQSVIPLRLLRKAGPGADYNCAPYMASWGNQLAFGYDATLSPSITFATGGTFSNGTPVVVTFPYVGSVEVTFTNSCYRGPGGDGAVDPMRVQVDVTNGNSVLYPFRWSFAPAGTYTHLAGAHVSHANPCFSDWPGVSAVPVRAGPQFEYSGSLSLSVISVE